MDRERHQGTWSEAMFGIPADTPDDSKVLAPNTIRAAKNLGRELATIAPTGLLGEALKVAIELYRRWSERSDLGRMNRS